MAQAAPKARRARLVTPPDFFCAARSRLGVGPCDFGRYHVAVLCFRPDDFVNVVHDVFPLCGIRVMILLSAGVRAFLECVMRSAECVMVVGRHNSYSRQFFYTSNQSQEPVSKNTIPICQMITFINLRRFCFDAPPPPLRTTHFALRTAFLIPS